MPAGTSCLHLGNGGVDWFINSGGSDKDLQNHFENCDVLLKDDAIVEFLIYFKDLIHLMMVDVDLHRSGLGSILISHSKKIIRKRPFNYQAGNVCHCLL